MSAQTAGNDSLRLELKQTTPTIPRTTLNPQKAPIPDSKKPASSLTILTSSPYISFGFLVPGDPLVRTDSIRILSTGIRGATVLITQNHPLKSSDEDTINNTTCDSGSCTPTQASVWKSPLTFGYGVRCENSPACFKDFSYPDFFRPLASQSLGEPANPILTTDEAEVTANIHYKLNIPSNQRPVPYANTVTYTLIPHL